MRVTIYIYRFLMQYVDSLFRQLIFYAKTIFIPQDNLTDNF